MLLDAIYFNGKKIGNVSEDGIDWGGDAAEYIKLFAAQVRNAPVKKIKKKDATNLLKFTLIELVPQNCKDVMGGTVDGTKLGGSLGIRFIGGYIENPLRNRSDYRGETHDAGRCGTWQDWR